VETTTAPTLTPCEPRTGGPAWLAAEEAGHDMSLIAANLRLNVAERLRLHDLALSAVLGQREAFVKRLSAILKATEPPLS